MSPTAARDLASAAVRFCRLLRARGLPVTPAESLDAVRVLEVIDLGDRAEVRRALRTVLVWRPEDFPVFDACFDAFWAGRSADPVDSLRAPGPETDGLPPALAAHLPAAKASELVFQEWGRPEDEAGQPVGLPRASDLERVMGKDFSTFSPDQLDEVARLAARLARRLATRRGRRRRPTRRGREVDLRRTLRLSLTRGEPVELARREKKRVKTKVVVLCDVSGSMDLYSRFLLQFLYSLQNQLGRMETFVFATTLTRITDELKGQSYRLALERLGRVRDWSGGTKIGESLQAFHAGWRWLLDRRTVVVILSDGWDTGEPELLAEALRLIRRRAARLIWLNPLLGNPDYQPLTQGMVAALPYLDLFAPAHNLDSLRALARHLRP